MRVIPTSSHVQESNPVPLHEVTSTSPVNLFNECDAGILETSKVQQENLSLPNELDLPIALRKETRTCTKKPVYPLSNFLSFTQFSPTHTTFLTNLNNISTPSSASEALSNRKWK